MIQAQKGNQIKFLIPELVEEIDPLAEPTVENITAEDVLQDDIADGGVIVNAWDGRPYFRPKIHTGNRALNGGFDSDTLWTRGAGWTISAGTANKAGGAPTDLSQADRLVIGVVYEVTFTVLGYSAGTVTAKAGTAAGTTRSGPGTFIEDITCAGNTSIVFSGDAASLLSIDNVFYRPKSLWRIDTALQRRAEKFVDFAMVVTHNLHEVYQAACENVLRFFQNTSDALPSDPLEATKTIYGLLGKPKPFISFDGVDNKAAIADSAQLDWGNGDGSIGGWFYIPDVSVDVFFLARFINSNNQMRLQFDAGNSELKARFEAGGVPMHHAVCDWTPTARTWYYLEWSFVNGVSNTLTINGIDQTLTIDTTTGGDMSIAADLDFAERNNVYYRMSSEGATLWNRSRSVAEALATFNGTPVAAADKGASQTSLLSNPGFETGGTGGDFDGGAEVDDGATDVFTSWTNNLIGTGKIEATLTKHSGNYAVKITTGDNENLRIQQNLVVNAVKKMRLQFWTRGDGTYAGGYRIYDSTNVLDIIARTTTGVTSTIWTLVTVEFNVPATSVLLTIFLYGNATAAAVVYFDDASIVQLGVVAEYGPDGINSVFGKWFDKANQLHATLTGVDYWHVPDADNPAFFFQAFDSFNSRYLFTQFNELLEAGQVDTRLGWIIYGQMYGFNFATGGYQANKNWPGVRIGETDVGVILAEQKFGERPSWTVTLLAQDDAGWESIQDMLARITGPLYPFYIIWDYSHKRPVIWQVRLDPEVPFTYVTGSDPWQGITFGLKAE